MNKQSIRVIIGTALIIGSMIPIAIYSWFSPFDILTATNPDVLMIISSALNILLAGRAAKQLLRTNQKFIEN